MSRTRVSRTRSQFSAVIAAALLAAALLAAAPSVIRAQGTPSAVPSVVGRIGGTVIARGGQPLGDAQIVIAGTRTGVVSRYDGSYGISGVAAGTYQIRVTRLGYKSATIDGVVVRDGEEARADVTMDAVPAALGAVVVSASRRAEKVTDAPATVTVIGTDILDRSVGNSFANALKEAKGVGFVQVGTTSVAINARGFNSSFNNRFLMVEDGRIAVLPENGLPVGQFTATPKVDLAGMEVLVGPGSALYGPDASSGVLSLTTKDPRQFPGATLEVTGGSRSYADVQGRYAGVRGNVGFKVAGEYQSANDWENYLSYNVGGTVVAPNAAGSVAESALRNPIDWKATTARGSGAVV